MAPFDGPPEATLYRLALYDCFLGELIRAGERDRPVTSSELARELSVREASVRRDLSFVSANGTRGRGYQLYALHDAIQEYLGLHADYPIVRVGTAHMLQALETLVPADSYGLKSVAYFSESPGDVGTVVGGLCVAHIAEIPDLDPALGVGVAMVACTRDWLEPVLGLLFQAGITGAFVLTPKVHLEVPEGMKVRHMRMPCDVKALAYTSRRSCVVPEPSLDEGAFSLVYGSGVW